MKQSAYYIIALAMLFFGYQAPAEIQVKEKENSGHDKFEKEIKENFLNLGRPLDFEYIQIESHGKTMITLRGVKIKLGRRSLEFCNKSDKKNLIRALMPFLDDEKFSGDAFILLAGTLQKELFHVPHIPDLPTYESQTDQGNWKEVKSFWIRELKVKCEHVLRLEENEKEGE